MNDDTVLREQLLEAEMRREMEEISEEEFQAVEADLLARIREIKQRREGGAGPLTTGGALPIETSPDSTFEIEASVTGDFYDPSQAPHTTIIENAPGLSERISVLDIEPGQAERAAAPGLPLSAPSRTRTSRTTRTARTIRTSGKLRKS